MNDTYDSSKPCYIIQTMNPFQGCYDTDILQDNIGNYEITDQGRLVIETKEGTLLKIYNKEHWFTISFSPGEASQEDTDESEAETNS
jgi:hypothetical protein